MKKRIKKCPSCNTTTYIENTKFKCVKCGWETIIEKNEKGEDIQIN
jgi:predicted RNA-binding Zn-ribbon protein involved in translation (DUF1610 family)